MKQHLLEMRLVSAFSFDVHHNRSLRMQLKVVWYLLLIDDTERPTLITGTAWLAFLAHRHPSCHRGLGRSQEFCIWIADMCRNKTALLLFQLQEIRTIRNPVMSPWRWAVTGPSDPKGAGKNKSGVCVYAIGCILMIGTASESPRRSRAGHRLPSGAGTLLCRVCCFP